MSGPVSIKHLCTYLFTLDVHYLIRFFQCYLACKLINFGFLSEPRNRINIIFKIKKSQSALNSKRFKWKLMLKVSSDWNMQCYFIWTDAQFHVFLWNGAEWMRLTVPQASLAFHLRQWLELQCSPTFNQSLNLPPLRFEFETIFKLAKISLQIKVKIFTEFWTVIIGTLLRLF